jgi:hypothetical protein
VICITSAVDLEACKRAGPIPYGEGYYGYT